MTQNSSVAQLLRNVYGYAFFNKMTLLTPVYAVFMQSHGVSDAALSRLMMLYPIAILIAQMPITKITNHIGQRYAVVVGQTLKALAFILFWAWPTYWGFAIGMLMWGMQYAFSEIAMDALLYDELAVRGAAQKYTRTLGRYYVAKTLGVALSACGSLLMIYGYGWVTAASVVALGLSAMCALNIRIMAPRAEKIPKKTHFIDLMRVGWRVGVAIPCVMNLMLLALMVANFGYLDDYLSPIGVAIGIPVEYVGMMPFIMLGASVLGQRIAYKFARIHAGILYGMICGTGTLFIVFSYFYSLGAIAALGAAYFLVGILNTLLYSRFQDSIPPRFRSILLSFYSIGSNTAYIAINLIIGLGSNLGSWRYGIAMLGAVMIWTGIWGARYVRNECNVPDADVRADRATPQIGTNSVA